MSPDDTAFSQGRAAKRARTEASVNDGATAASVDVFGAACERCHDRKVKCGGEFPVCAGCSRAGLPCMAYDPSAPRSYTREELRRLHAKALRLEAELRGAAGSPPQETAELDDGEATGTSSTSASFASNARVLDGPQSGHVRSTRTENRFVGQESAFGSFLSRLQPSHARGTATARPERRELRTPRMSYHAPHPFPDHETALAAIREYFHHHQPVQPILSRDAVYDALNRHCLDTIDRPSTKPTELFRLFMAIALGSVGLFRRGSIKSHPFGYFTAALEAWTLSMSSFNTIEDIEQLLLIAQFGFFYDIGCSIWELGRLSMRTAVELGLHRITNHTCPSLADTGRLERVFWMTYMLDRSSSYTLGRPFAIDDTSIATSLPDPNASTLSPSHNWRISLSRLTSQIRRQLRPKSGLSQQHKDKGAPSHQALHTASTEFSGTIALLRKFDHQLREWRTNATPHVEYESPACLVESSWYFDLLYQEARLGLLRAATERLTMSPISLTKSLRRSSLVAACSIISNFDRLKDESLFICTRAEAHLIFVTGLVSLSLSQASEVLADDQHGQQDVDEDLWLDFLDDSCYPMSRERLLHTIDACGNLLVWLSEALPDFAICASIFEETRRNLNLERSDVSRQRAQPMPSAHVSSTSELQGRGDSSGIQTSNDAVAIDQSWPAYATGETGGHTSSMTLNPTNYQGQVAINQSAFAGPELASQSIGPFGMDAALSAEDYGIPPTQLVHGMNWPLSNFEGMAAIDACFSGYVWDSLVPWEGSPSATMDSV